MKKNWHIFCSDPKLYIFFVIYYIVAVPNNALAKKPLEFSNPMGTARLSQFGTNAGKFPRGASNHLFYNYLQKIYNKKNDAYAMKLLRQYADSSILMQLTDQQIRTMLKPYTGFDMTRCPRCKKPYQSGIILWEWDVNDPDHIKCTSCGVLLPNSSYPDSCNVTIIGPDGTSMVYPYYQDSDGVRYFYCCKIQQIAQERIAHSSLMYVVDGFTATGDIRYARKLAVLLAHLAQIYPSLPFHGTGKGFGEAGSGYLENFYDPNPPHEYLSGRWYNIAPSEGYYVANQAIAYSCIYHTGILKDLSKELGYDIRLPIERDLLYPAAEMICEIPHLLRNYESNAIIGLAAVGRCLNDPNLVNESIEWMQDILTNAILRDGMWYEGTIGYHYMTSIGISDAAEILCGYSEPVECKSKYFRNFKSLNPYEQYPVLKTYITAPLDLHWPDGSMVLFGDTSAQYTDFAYYCDRTFAIAKKNWPNENPINSLDLQHEPSEIKEGVGLLLLRMGSPNHRSQLVFSYGPTAGHHHFDRLGINFFAFGDEMLSERGYTYTSLRPFATGTLSHNTVVIDGQGQPYSRGADVKNLIINLNETKSKSPVQFCQAYGDDIYSITSNNKGKYRRSTAMISVDDVNAYLVDIFEVNGGKQHDYFLHGSCKNEMVVEFSLPLKQVDGTLQDLMGSIKGEDKYSSMNAIKLTGIGKSHDGRFETVFSYIDPNLKDIKLKTYFDIGKSVDVIIGKASTIRKSQEKDENLNRSLTAALCIRSQNEQTTYSSVMVPFKGRNFVKGVSRITVDSNRNVYAVKVYMDSYVDYIFIGSEHSKIIQITDGTDANHQQNKFIFDGNFALARFTTNSSGTPKLKLIVSSDTKDFSVNGNDYSSGKSYTGKITGIGGDILRRTRSYFETDAILPSGDKLAGRVILVSRPDGVSDTYVIGLVDQSQKGSRIYLRQGTSTVEIENTVASVDDKLNMIEMSLPFRRAARSAWQFGRRLKIAERIFVIKDVPEALNSSINASLTTLTVEPAEYLKDIKQGDKIRIFSNVEGDRWKINALRVEHFLEDKTAIMNRK